MTKHGESKDIQVSFPSGNSRQVIYGEGEYTISGDAVVLKFNKVNGLRKI